MKTYDNTLVEWSVLHVEAIMQLLEGSLRATYFQVDDIVTCYLLTC
jgi:hypothetical protein